MTRTGSPKAQEVRSLFDREAERWSRRYAEGGSMAGRIDRFRAALAERLAPGARVLDLGCGSGDITGALHAAGWDMAGADVSPRMLERARAAHPDVPFSAVPPADDMALPFEDGAFDAVVASSVLEYVARPGPALAEVARVLRPGGALLATVPDPRHRGRRLEQAARALLRVPGVARLARRSDYAEYLRLSRNRLTPAAWWALAREAGLEPEAPPGPCTGPLILLAARRAAATGGA